MSIQALERAIGVLDGQSALARILTEKTGKRVTQKNVWSWLNRTQKTPPELAPFIEAATAERGDRVTREELCPDFPWAPVQSDAELNA